MKAKTKDQLRGEIITLEIERDALKQELKDATSKIANTLLAFLNALGSEQARIKYSADKNDNYDVLAGVATSFFAELKRLVGYDITNKNPESLEAYCDIMGFDEATVTVIKQRIQIYYEMSKMIHEGKSAEEIQEFVKKQREAEGR